MTKTIANAAPVAANADANSAETSPRSKEAAGILKRSSSYNIDARAVMRKPGFNPRFDFGDIAALAASLEHNGMLNPIRVKRVTDPAIINKDASQPIHFELVDGDRRLTAIELLIKQGKYDAAFPSGIPAILVDKAQDDITSLVQMFEANSGKVFLPLEESAAYQRMRDAGMTIKEICKATGRAHLHVNEMLALSQADASVKDAVARGEIGKSDAKTISRVARGDKARQAELVEAAKAAKASGKAAPAKAAAKKAIDKVRQDNAAAKGKKLKVRPLSAQELAELGSTVANHLIERLNKLDIDPNSDLRAWIQKDIELVAAYTLGALDGLRAAAGQGTDLIIK